MQARQTIGLIGLGRMGHGIAKNLLAAGHWLTFQEHPGNNDPADVMAAGAAVRPTPAAVAGDCEIVIICVTGSPEVEEVVLGPHGVLDGLREGTIVVDCSTAIPESTLEVSGHVIQSGGRFLDAAMTRTPKEADEGRLNLLVGADPVDLEAVRPILACFAETIVHAGPVGAGHRLKLIHNFVSLGFSAILAEAVAVADAEGTPRDLLVDVLGNGGGRSVALDRFAPYIADGDTSAMAFSIANAHKDISYFREMARATGLTWPTDTAGHIADLFAAVGEAGGQQRTVPEAIDILRDLAE